MFVALARVNRLSTAEAYWPKSNGDRPQGEHDNDWEAGGTAVTVAAPHVRFKSAAGS